MSTPPLDPTAVQPYEAPIELERNRRIRSDEMTKGVTAAQ